MLTFRWNKFTDLGESAGVGIVCLMCHIHRDLTCIGYRGKLLEGINNLIKIILTGQMSNKRPLRRSCSLETGKYEFYAKSMIKLYKRAYYETKISMNIYMK